MRRWRRAMVASVVVLIGGCGGDDERIPEAVSAELQDHVAAVRVAAVAGDRPLAEQRLAELRGAVEAARSADELSAPAAAEILEAADGVETQLDLLAPAVPATTTTSAPPVTTTTTTPAPPPSVVVNGGGGDQDGEDDDEENDGEGRRDPGQKDEDKGKDEEKRGD